MKPPVPLSCEQRLAAMDAGELPPAGKPRYVLVLEADGRRDEADQLRKLRAVLQRLLRTYGLRCIDVREATPEAEACGSFRAGPG